jgi:hypothetical protein
LLFVAAVVCHLCVVVRCLCCRWLCHCGSCSDIKNFNVILPPAVGTKDWGPSWLLCHCHC